MLTLFAAAAAAAASNFKFRLVRVLLLLLLLVAGVPKVECAGSFVEQKGSWTRRIQNAEIPPLHQLLLLLLLADVCIQKKVSIP